MNCSNCGNQNDESNRFCSNCGQERDQGRALENEQLLEDAKRQLKSQELFDLAWLAGLAIVLLTYGAMDESFFWASWAPPSSDQMWMFIGCLIISSGLGFVAGHSIDEARLARVKKGNSFSGSEWRYYLAIAAGAIPFIIEGGNPGFFFY